MFKGECRTISATLLKEHFLKRRKCIDVRAPVEFAKGRLPGAVNLPLINDSERHFIGIEYAKNGQDSAVQLGHQLVNGETRNLRIQSWLSFLSAHPDSFLYCFRGGQRSRISQEWIRNAGTDVIRIEGGYKAARGFLIEESERIALSLCLLVVSGGTGSGKTELIQKVHTTYPAVDLEDLAKHRGSAFGAMTTAQPTQVDFENELAVSLLTVELMSSQNRPTLFEDESRMIGRCQLPAALMQRMQMSPILWIDEPLESRITRVFSDYILRSDIGASHLFRIRSGASNGETTGKALAVFAQYKAALRAIDRRLGGLRAQEILADLERSEREFNADNSLESNRNWIEKMLVYYYDPLYESAASRKNSPIVFKGSLAECVCFLSEK